MTDSTTITIKSQEPPSALTSQQRWVLWKDIDGKKLPFQTNGQPAKANDATTWTSYTDAKRAVNGSYSGLGFVFNGDGIAGVDFDDCVNDEGTIQGWAQKWIDKLGTYAEISPSGKGVKVFGLGRLTGSGKKKLLDNGGGVEN